MYEIYAYGNNDSLYGIFNAIAAIMGANSYLQAIAMVAFCGFVTAGIAYAFMPHKLIGWQWLASVLLVYSILFVPKVTVGIVDKLGTQPVQVVSNVPFGVAFFGNLTSTIGNTLTEVFETAFQTLPGPAQQSADLTYQRHGVMFGNTLIKRTRQIVFDDPNFRTDLVNFIHNCTMFDLADGTIDPAAFSKAPVGAGDLWSLMATPNPARFSSITTGGVSDIEPCPAVYANLNARLPAITNLSVQKLAALLNPDLPLAQAVTEVSNQASQAYLRASLGGAGIAVADIVRQNGLINAINDTSDIIGQKINDPGSLILGLGRAQATAQTNAAWLNFGKMAEDALPLIRNAIEAIIYALFPLVILLLLLTYGLGTMRALQSYLLTLVWIQLWPPVYAILNYMASIASAKHIAAAAELGAGINGLAIVSASPVLRRDIVAIGGGGIRRLAHVDDLGAGKARQHRLHQRIGTHAVLEFGLARFVLRRGSTARPASAETVTIQRRPVHSPSLRDRSPTSVLAALGSMPDFEPAVLEAHEPHVAFQRALDREVALFRGKRDQILEASEAPASTGAGSASRAIGLASGCAAGASAARVAPRGAS